MRRGQSCWRGARSDQCRGREEDLEEEEEEKDLNKRRRDGEGNIGWTYEMQKEYYGGVARGQQGGERGYNL